MCAVSAVIDNWKNTFQLPTTPTIPISFPPQPSPFKLHDDMQYVSKKEFDKLKREFEALKTLLLAAKKYDEETNQPDCEMAEKVALVRKVADQLGVNVDEVFGEKYADNPIHA